jgi:hypothetical protein
MAGGMNRRVRGDSIAERVGGRPPSPDAGCPARHCWVADAVDGSGVKRPGLLVEWRRTAGGWEGRVVYAAELRGGVWALVEEWLPAALLAPL